MAVPFRSIDDALANDASQGSLTRLFYCSAAATTTAATATSGLTSWRRYDRTFTVPTFTGNAYMTYFRAMCAQAAQMMVAIEIPLGSIALSTGTFTDGSVMPTRTIGGGSSAQLATVIPMMYVSVATTATTPTITVTYTDQGGTGSNSCALTLPTSPVASTAFAMQPHMASGDTGIQDVTNITKSAGTVGTLAVVGLLPLAFSGSLLTTAAGHWDPLAGPHEMYPIQSGDVISFWASSTGQQGLTAAFQLQAEV